MPNPDLPDRVRCNKAVNQAALGGELYNSLLRGAIPVHVFNLATNPTATDTMTIGDDTYEWVAAAGDVADDGNIGVVLAGTVAASRTNLVAAINGTATATGLFQTDSTTPALYKGTENVVAVVVGNTVEVRTANTPGGTAAPTGESITVAETMTAAADLWVYGNVNFNTLAGPAGGGCLAAGQVTVTAAMITAGTVQVDFPFTPTWFQVEVWTASDVQRPGGSDTYEISGNGILITLGGGSDPDVQATDTIRILAGS